MSSHTDDEDCEELQMVVVSEVRLGWTGQSDDRRRSVGTEDGGGIGDGDIGA